VILTRLKKETLEEMVTRIKAELKREKAKREESEYRHAVTCEALENLLDAIDSSSFNHMYYSQRKEARKVLNEVDHD
jgi:hypothetical protein